VSAITKVSAFFLWAEFKYQGSHLKKGKKIIPALKST